MTGPADNLLRLADDMIVGRLGYGAMQLPGPGVWGPPQDHGTALAVLRRAVELGVTHIDTNDFYGPHVANDLIKEALHPHPDDLVIAPRSAWSATSHAASRPPRRQSSCANTSSRTWPGLTETGWTWSTRGWVGMGSYPPARCRSPSPSGRWPTCPGVA